MFREKNTVNDFSDNASAFRMQLQIMSIELSVFRVINFSLLVVRDQDNRHIFLSTQSCEAFQKLATQGGGVVAFLVTKFIDGFFLLSSRKCTPKLKVPNGQRIDDQGAKGVVSF